MDNELIHISRRIREAESSNAIPASFGRAECKGEERDIGRGEDGEVVRHCCDFPFWEGELKPDILHWGVLGKEIKS